MTTFKISYLRYSFTNIDTNEILIWTSACLILQNWRAVVRLLSFLFIWIRNFFFLNRSRLAAASAMQDVIFQYLFFLSILKDAPPEVAALGIISYLIYVYEWDCGARSYSHMATQQFTVV